VDFLSAEGGLLRLSDFRDHSAEWTESLSLEFQGRTVHTLPPNSQGMALLQLLAMAEARGIGDGRGLDEARGALDPLLLHTLVEAKKRAFADRDRWVADPGVAPAPLDRLLDRAYLAERAQGIGSRAAADVPPGFGEPLEGDPAEGDGDTVYLIAVDQDGNAVSWIQSLFSSFGSRLVEPETGIVLQNRGGGFTLQEGHPNLIAPGKRPFHTLMATLVTGPDGGFEMALGTPGGHGQAQTVAQALVQMLVFDASPQHAAEIPRFRSTEGLALSLEDRVPAPVRSELAGLGHDLTVVEGWTAFFGNLHVIRREANGVLRAGADMRREGAALAW
jgi:gamma-glutamyltranspeptidase